MNRTMSCNIVMVGQRRDGGTRYWCLSHKANATAKYGIPMKKCLYAHVPPIGKGEKLRIDPKEYQGGVAIWGAVPPVYDTTLLPLDKGIHVHARNDNYGTKSIDKTYRAVIVSVNGKEFEFDELEAIYHMVSNFVDVPTKFIECPKCSHPHLDKDWFSIHPHKRHLCSGCGKYFSDCELGVGNPICETLNALDSPSNRNPQQSTKELQIEQSQFPGGIRIWGSNPAILWTSDRSEESGIHVHAYAENGTEPKIDDTYGKVEIDDLELDPLLVQTLMVQNCLPYLRNRIVSLQCNKCHKFLFDQGFDAFVPKTNHFCRKCDNFVKSNSKKRKVVSNPLIEQLEAVSFHTERPRIVQSLDLIPE